MKKQRKQYAPEEKVAILRRHLLEKEPISKLCDDVGLQPAVFYRWQERVAYLQKKIQTKDEVLAEHVALKKRFGEL
jgi:transposase-like protein